MAKREYLEQMWKRYLKAPTKSARTALLNEICATTGYNRKYVIRWLGKKERSAPTEKKKRGRKSKYNDPTILQPLRVIRRAANYPCSKRLVAMIPDWLPKYEEYHGELDPDVRSKLLEISAATIDRQLKAGRLGPKARGLSTTKPGGLLRAQIPIQTGQWEERRPGFVEADTVAHCGGSMAGEFAFTLDCVDIATGWSEQRALWNKSADGVVRQMRSIERALPFPLRGFDADNGSEFINVQLVRHFFARQQPVQFTRSRAYRKNDNAHVEQKNWTHVRQWIGYERIDNQEAVALLNDLYENEWRLYHNFYCPSVKLLSKERVGARIRRKYDKPKTPYHRIMESQDISEHTKRHLSHVFEHTNPFVLRKAIDAKLRKIFKLCYNPPAKNQGTGELGDLYSEATTPFLRRPR